MNAQKTLWVVDRVASHAERFKNPRVACLGLAYKPDVDDLRESPAVQVVRALTERVAGTIMVVEPNLTSHAEFNLMGLDEALREADIVVILVAHSEFRKMSPAAVEEKIVVDTCGVLRKAATA